MISALVVWVNSFVSAKRRTRRVGVDLDVTRARGRLTLRVTLVSIFCA